MLHTAGAFFRYHSFHPFPHSAVSAVDALEPSIQPRSVHCAVMMPGPHTEWRRCHRRCDFAVPPETFSCVAVQPCLSHCLPHCRLNSFHERCCSPAAAPWASPDARGSPSQSRWRLAGCRQALHRTQQLPLGDWSSMPRLPLGSLGGFFRCLCCLLCRVHIDPLLPEIHVQPLLCPVHLMSASRKIHLRDEK